MKTTLKKITVGMQNQELVDALNNNFGHLENVIKEQGKLIADGMTKGHEMILEDISNLFANKITTLEDKVEKMEKDVKSLEEKV